MKVLHVTTNYPTPEYPIFGIFVKEQVDSLREAGAECDVFYCDGQGKGFRKYITYVPKLWRRALFGGYDIIHCHHALSAIILCLTGAPLFKKVVLSYQNDPSNEWGDGFFRFFNLLFKAFIFKNPLGRYASCKKVHYIPNGCNENFFVPMDRDECRKRLGWDARKKYLIYMDSNKGIRTQKRRDRFVDTVSILVDKYGYDAEMVEMRNVARELVPIYLNASDLHLISSDFEGSPNSVKECMMCNVPVVSTDVGNVREMIGDIPGAYVVDGFSAESLASACDEALRGAQPFEGRKALLDKGYGMSAVARRILDLYDKIMSCK